KLSDGLDAGRLRPRCQSNWRFRIVAAIAALLAMLGVLMTLTCVSSLPGHTPALGELTTNKVGSAVILVIGLFVLYVGVWLWCRCRRRSRQSQALNMS
ncbi:hypothetical protein, partial [Pseudomonas frederiksbergensis]